MTKMRMTRPQDSEAATATSIAAGEKKLPPRGPALFSLIFCTILKGRTSDAALDRWIRREWPAFYKLLGVAVDATTAAVKKAYKVLARKSAEKDQ